MGKYYDERCPLCDRCHYLGDGEYPSGEKYEACRLYGYILHRTVQSDCSGFVTEEDWRRREEQKQKIKRLRR